MSGPAFALRSVGKRYGALTALTAVSLEGLPGECLALVGHNGAGKTTLMKLLLGLVRPSEGTVRPWAPTRPRLPATRRGSSWASCPRPSPSMPR